MERGDDVSIWLSWEDDRDAAALDYDLRLDYPGRGRSISDNPRGDTEDRAGGDDPLDGSSGRYLSYKDQEIRRRRVPGRLHLFTT